MKSLKLAVFITSLLFFSFSIQAQSFLENIPPSNTPQQLNTFLNNQLQIFYSNNEDIREEIFDKAKETLGSYIYEERNLFLLKILTDFVQFKNYPNLLPEDDLDDLRDEQEKTVELIAEISQEEDAPFSTRIEAIRALRSFLVLPDKNSFPFSLIAAKSLLGSLESNEPQIVHAAMVSLQSIAISSDPIWEDYTEDVIDALGDHCSSSDPEIQRIATIEILEVLKQSKTLTSPIENLWEKVADCIEEIDSNELKESLHPKIIALVKSKQATPFESFTKEIREQVVTFGVNQELELDPIPELLDEFRTSRDLEDLENLKLSIQHQLKTYPEYRFITLLQLASFATDSEVTHHKLRVITNTMLSITRQSPYSMQFFHTSVNMPGLVDAHRTTSRPMIPLTALMALLSSTDAPGIQIPLLSAVKDSTLTGLPIWIKRKLISILFYMADDAISKSTRLHAFYSLTDLVKQDKSLTVKWLASQRIKQLSTLATNKNIRNLASKWK